MYVCMYVGTYAGMYVCMYVCMHACMYVGISDYVYIFKYIYIYLCLSLSPSPSFVSLTKFSLFSLLFCHYTMTYHDWLVVPNPLKNMKVSWDDYS